MVWGIETSSTVMRFYLATFSLLMTSSAVAGFNGNEMHVQCENDNMLFIMGYASGFTEKTERDRYAFLGMGKEVLASMASREIDKVRTAYQTIDGYCLPDGVSTGQIADVFCQYLRDNPARRHEDSSELISSAFAKAWPRPCSQ